MDVNMEYFTTEEDVLVAFRAFFTTVARDLAGMHKKSLFGYLPTTVGEDDQPLNDRVTTKWLLKANDMVSTFTLIRHGHLDEYKKLLERSSRVATMVDSIINTDDEIIELMADVRDCLSSIRHDIGLLIASAARVGIYDPILKKLQVMEGIDPGKYLNDAFVLEEIDSYGIPLI